MATFNLDDVTAALESTKVTPSGVSFAGKSLKLNTEDDAKPVIDAIRDCKELQFLNLEGNTLGVDASIGIAKALEGHPEFKRALWKDMFTGRLRTEIPQALKYLGDGLVAAGARLTELDLSDNAFGPIGVEGLASLLRSTSCYALEELRLNNNGLGIGGGKLLASALLDCYESSKQQGKPLALKVFIAGRNRLENDGAKALSEVFKTIGTLEEIAMPQNGIYHVGIAALSESFRVNNSLEILDLNDNTIGPKGGKAIASVLPGLRNLRVINFGDCLLKNKGARYLASGLHGCPELEELVLGFNEIGVDGGKQLIKVLSNKSKLKSLVLNGNMFGDAGKEDIANQLKDIGKVDILGSLSDDEGADRDEDSSDSESEGDDSESSDAEENVNIEQEQTADDIKGSRSTVSIRDFLLTPNSDNFLGLGNNRADLLIKEATNNSELYLETFVPILMKVSALAASKDNQVLDLALNCSEQLYRELFTWAAKSEYTSIMNNALLVHLDLIKSEDKKFKTSWNIEGCLSALANVLKKNYVPESTKDTLKLFMQREIDNNKEYLNAKKNVLSALN